MIKSFLSAPVFDDDEEKTRSAKLLHQILLASWGLPFMMIGVSSFNPSVASFAVPTGAAVAIMLFVLMLMNRQGRVNLASTLLVAVFILIFANLNLNTGGEPRPLLLLTVIVIITSGLLLGSRAPIIITLLLIAQHTAIVILNSNGILHSNSIILTPSQNIISTALSYLIIAFILRLAILRNQVVVDQLRESERNLQESNRDLQDLSTSLEQHVADRTQELAARSSDLEEVNVRIQRRAAQFEALAQVARSISAIRNLQELLPQVATMVSDNYGFYHVGVFIIDEANEYAMLAASNSSGGQKMLERQHRLRVGEEGIVGKVTATGEPRIALDVGDDPVFFNNPDLPETHSEMALPIRSGEIIIGALDVQSTEKGAFTIEDLQTLSLLADQVGLAIENARLFEDSKRALADLQLLMRQTTRDAWKKLPEQQSLLGYRYDMMGASPLKERVESAGEGKAGEKSDQTELVPYVVPIKLRGEIIGNLFVQSPTGDEWNEDQQDLIKAVAERVALSAENARLFEETTRRAERERLVSEITGKIRSHNDPQSMIETAVNELRSALGASRIEIIPQTTKETGKKKSKV